MLIKCMLKPSMSTTLMGHFKCLPHPQPFLEKGSYQEFSMQNVAMVWDIRLGWSQLNGLENVKASLIRAGQKICQLSVTEPDRSTPY